MTQITKSIESKFSLQLHLNTCHPEEYYFHSITYGSFFPHQPTDLTIIRRTNKLKNYWNKGLLSEYSNFL